MSMPGFTAAASVYNSRSVYRAAYRGLPINRSIAVTAVARDQTANLVSMTRAGIRRIPGPFGDIVIIGGPLDPGDPLPCEGRYVCTRFFGTDYCFWTCEIV
jgi:hypothetical protein